VTLAGIPVDHDRRGCRLSKGCLDANRIEVTTTNGSQNICVTREEGIIHGGVASGREVIPNPVVVAPARGRTTTLVKDICANTTGEESRLPVRNLTIRGECSSRRSNKMILTHSHRSGITDDPRRETVTLKNITMPMFHKNSEVAFWGETMPNLSSMGMDLRESPKEKNGYRGEMPTPLNSFQSLSLKYT